MKIAIIGSGMVGGALGKRFAGSGHQVMIGVRTPGSEKVAALLEEAGPNASAATLADATAFGDAIILATTWEGTSDAIKSCGDFVGKPLLDATNPLNASMSGLESSPGNSGGEQVQRWATSAKVVKIFNTTGFMNMLNPAYDGQPSVMFYAGDDAAAKNTARQLSDELGFDSVDAGGLDQSFVLENLALLWISLAYKQNMGPNFAFGLMRRT